MDAEFINLTSKNIADEHLCCLIRSRVAHPGIEAKRKWLKERLNEGHIFRKLNEKATVFIEYAPLETAWVPVVGDNYFYIYCLWVNGDCKGKGYGKQLLEYCINEAKLKGRSGVCMLGAKRQKLWLSDQSFAKKFGFKIVDSTDNGYELLALSFDGTNPRFAESAKKEEIESNDLTIYYDFECPYIFDNIKKMKDYCKANNIPASFIEVDSLQKAKELPCVFNNFGVFYKGKFQTVNISGVQYIEKLLKK